MNKTASSAVEGLSNPNLLINGDFSVWQRGEASTTTWGKYTADRWVVGGNGASGVANFKYQADRRTYYAITAGGLDSYKAIGQRIEAEQLWGFDNTVTLTLSFECVSYAGDENDSVWFRLSKPTAKNDWTGEVDLIPAVKIGDFNGSVRSTYTHTFTVSADDLVDGLGVYFGTFNSVSPSTPNTINTLFSNAKLEVGSQATPFIPDSPQVNLAKCQRYYEKGRHRSVSGNTMAGASVTYVQTTRFSSTKRGVPSMSFTDNSGNSGKCSTLNQFRSVVADNVTISNDVTRDESFTVTSQIGTSAAGYSFCWTADAEL